jgi:hypothetical protein
MRARFIHVCAYTTHVDEHTPQRWQMCAVSVCVCAHTHTAVLSEYLALGVRLRVYLSR